MTLTRYALERLLYRLSQSDHRDRFVLKGAILFLVWSVDAHRPTRDLDLLGYGWNDVADLERVFREIVATPVEEDAIVFLGDVHGRRIKEDQEYEGVRLRLEARIGNARVPIQIDVGFGDAITPAPQPSVYPTLLAFPAPQLLTYPRETVIAEKFHAMVALGIVNTRMKDLYDVWTLSRLFDFDGEVLCKAITRTFERRRTLVPVEVPTALSPEFIDDAGKQRQWNAFLKRTRLGDESLTLADVVVRLRAFLLPLVSAASRSEDFTGKWIADDSWRAGDESKF